MRSSTLKWIVLSATLLAAVVVTVQLYWLKKVYSFEQRQFNINVVKSIRGLFEDLKMNDAPGISLQQLIDAPDNNYFTFKADTIPPKDSLVFNIQVEFANFGVLTDCKLGAYSSTEKKFVYEEFIPTPASRYAGVKPPAQELPVYDNTRGFDHILLYFPHRQEYILEQMDFWIVSTVILFLALIGLAASLFYFYRQKFLAEIQKDFVNNFTHEFKTPLAVMKIAADVLSQESIVHQPDRLERYSAIIRNQTEHLQSQVERLLRAASIESRDLPIRKEDVDPQLLIEQALGKVQPLIDQKRARVEVKIDDGTGNGRVHADRAHLELAVVNLLENALKYSHDPHIVVETGRMEDDFFISVKDNGVGIERQYLKNIFKKFYRVPTGDIHDVKGFGLGLNFVKRIIDAHKGRIRVHSLPGIGTEFRLFIPLN
ncbi:MAG TPA: HAMP domain-containing sensor histidine kinase [Puia sp.]|uniref:sensor histidine kinase n=1 Tax=Puia sp. TaxID=2045100 RepID=UPI002B607696|nr:HAMP domain-containing sensor histidine kinase [Puia sp.]HVU96717.1 HAMP domain-containing sensor histidine kinase [Puia sp.]